MLLLILFSIFAANLADPQFLELIYMDSTTTVDVEVGSNLFLSSNDKATLLSKITLTNGNKTIQANNLLSPFKEDGSMAPWTLTDPTLTIVSTNDEFSTDLLSGYFYITTAAQAQDPNFHVFKVHKTHTLEIKKSSTVVLMSVKKTRSGSAPIYEPYRNTLITNIVQKKTTTLRVYGDMPNSNYKDVKGSMKKQMFSNPIDYPTNDNDHKSVFFDNVEPIQFPHKILYLTVDDDVALTVSNKWQDQIIYNTTAITTTGMITYHLFEVNTTVNFQINPGNNRTVGLIFTVEDLVDTLDYTFYSSSSQSSISLSKGAGMNHAFYSTDVPATQLYGVPGGLIVGVFYLQYFGIDGISLPITDARTPTHQDRLN